MRRGREITSKSRIGAVARAPIVALLVVLSIFAQMIVKAERASAAEASICEIAVSGQQAGNIGFPHSGHAGKGADHCGVCVASTSSLPPQHDLSLSQVAPIVRSVALRSIWIVPPELGRAGETRSRAPPAIS
jgi:hypothetical protein